MERPPKKCVCEKCGYLVDTPEHEGCDYLAWTTGEQRYIDHLEAELAALRASPASAPEGFNHSIGADRFTAVRGTYWWHVRAGDGTQNIGKFHTKLAAEDMAPALLTAFRDGAFMQYQAMLGSAPTPPVSEDRWLPIETAPKDGREVWCFNGEHCVMRWISGEGYALWVYVDPLRSDADPEPEQPSHWMPLPEAPAMQEDKP